MSSSCASVQGSQKGMYEVKVPWHHPRALVRMSTPRTLTRTSSPPVTVLVCRVRDLRKQVSPVDEPCPFPCLHLSQAVDMTSGRNSVRGTTTSLIGCATSAVRYLCLSAGSTELPPGVVESWVFQLLIDHPWPDGWNVFLTTGVLPVTQLHGVTTLPARSKMSFVHLRRLTAM